jgi:hypothetical protein
LAVGEEDHSLSPHLWTKADVSVDVDDCLRDGEQLGKVYIKIVLYADSLVKGKRAMGYPDSHSVISC